MNYPELGSVDQKTEFHPEGAEYTHPSGYVYKRMRQTNGAVDWIAIKNPDGSIRPLPETVIP